MFIVTPLSSKPCSVFLYKWSCCEVFSFILTWHRGRRDQEGGSLRMRPLHCTPLGLRPAISPNVGNSGAQFMVVGVCVRAAPVLFDIKGKREEDYVLEMCFC